jgi:hypothetical protein
MPQEEKKKVTELHLSLIYDTIDVTASREDQASSISLGPE